jgi:hypothetical protein
MNEYVGASHKNIPWNKGKLVGQKAPLKVKDIWAIRLNDGSHNHLGDPGCVHPRDPYVRLG